MAEKKNRSLLNGPVGCILIFLVVIIIMALPGFNISNQPTSIYTRTPDLSSSVRAALGNTLAPVTFVGIQGSQITVQFEITESDYDRLRWVDTQILDGACKLFRAGFHPNWYYKIQGVITVVNISTGQTSRRVGLDTFVASTKVAEWNCANTFQMNAAFALNEYNLDPLLTR